MSLPRVIFITLLIPFLTIYPTPKDLTVWFISEKDKEAIKSTFIQSKNRLAILEIKDIPRVDESDESSIKVTPATSSDLIDCSKKGTFDLFCTPPKEEKTAPPPLTWHPKQEEEIPLEIWVDVSASMNYVDPLNEKRECYRATIATTLKKECKPSRYRITLFTTKFFPLKFDGELCGIDGLNDYKDLLKKIKAAHSSHLVIITDIFELREEFISGLKKMKAKIKGEFLKNKIKAKDIPTFMQEITPDCQ